MAFDLGTIGGAITLNGSQYFSTMDRVDDVTRSTMGNVKKYVADAVTVYGSYRLAKAAALASMDFEKEVSNIRSIGQELNKANLSRELLKINSELGRSKDLAAATYFAYSAGIRGTEKQMADFTTQIAGTNKAVNGELVPTMNALTTVMKAYNISITDAAKAGDWYYTIIKQGKTTGAELSTSLGQVIGNANMAGVALEHLGAGIAALTTIMPTAQAMTGLNQVINGFIKPTDEAKKTAQQYGIELSAAALKAKGFAGAIEEIRQKVGTDPDAIAKMFTSVEAIKAIAPLLGSLNNDFKANVTEFENNAGAMNKALTEQLDNSASKWTGAMNDINKALITTGDAIKPFTDLLASVIGGFGRLVQSAPPAAVQVAALGVAVMLIRSKLIPLIKDLIMMPSNLAAISTSLRANTGAIGAETGAWTANTAAIKANNVARSGHNAGVMAASGMSMMDHNERAFNAEYAAFEQKQAQAARHSQIRHGRNAMPYQNWLYSGQDGQFQPLPDRGSRRPYGNMVNQSGAARMAGTPVKPAAAGRFAGMGGRLGGMGGRLGGVGGIAALGATIIYQQMTAPKSEPDKPDTAGSAGPVNPAELKGTGEKFLDKFEDIMGTVLTAVSFMGTAGLAIAGTTAGGYKAGKWLSKKAGISGQDELEESQRKAAMIDGRLEVLQKEQLEHAQRRLDRLIKEEKISKQTAGAIREQLASGERGSYGKAVEMIRGVEQNGDAKGLNAEFLARQNARYAGYKKRSDDMEPRWNYDYDMAKTGQKQELLDQRLAREQSLLSMAQNEADQKAHQQKIYELLKERKRLELAIIDESLSKSEREQQTAYNRWYAMAISKSKNEYLLEKEANDKQIEMLKEKVKNINELWKQSTDKDQKDTLSAALAAAAAELQGMIKKQAKSGKDMATGYTDKYASYVSGIFNDKESGLSQTEMTKQMLAGADSQTRALYAGILKEEQAKYGNKTFNGQSFSEATALERFVKAVEKQNRAVQRKEELTELRKLNQTLGKGTTVVWTLPNS